MQYCDVVGFVRKRIIWQLCLLLMADYNTRSRRAKNLVDLTRSARPDAIFARVGVQSNCFLVKSGGMYHGTYIAFIWLRSKCMMRADVEQLQTTETTRASPRRLARGAGALADRELDLDARAYLQSWDIAWVVLVMRARMTQIQEKRCHARAHDPNTGKYPESGTFGLAKSNKKSGAFWVGEVI